MKLKDYQAISRFVIHEGNWNKIFFNPRIFLLITDFYWLRIHPFLVACTQLYNPLCPSVCRSVGLLEKFSFFLSFYVILSHFKLSKVNSSQFTFSLSVFWSFSFFSFLVLTTARDCKVLALFNSISQKLYFLLWFCIEAWLLFCTAWEWQWSVGTTKQFFGVNNPLLHH